MNTQRPERPGPRAAHPPSSLPATLLAGMLWAAAAPHAAAQTVAPGSGLGLLDYARADAGPPAADAQALRQLTQRLDGLDQTLKSTADGVYANRQAIAEQAEKLEAERKRVDPIALRVDSLAEQVEQHDAAIDKHQTRIEDNSVKLYETLLGIDATGQELETLRDSLRRLANPKPGGAAGGGPGGKRGGDGGKLLGTLALGLLLPVGFTLYEGGRAGTRAPAPGVPDPGARNLLAWLGGILGYALIGFGVMFGATQGGWVGSPVEFLPDLARTGLVQDLPERLTLLASQLALAGTLGLVVCSAVGRRLSALGHLLTALLAGALIYPLFGHWVAAGRLLADNRGWLEGSGFMDPGGATGVAALAGFSALSLALGLPRRGGRKGGKAQAASGEPPAGETTTWAGAGALLLWTAWHGVILSASETGGPVGRMVVATSLAAAGSALAVLVIGSLFEADDGWLQRLAGGVLAGVVAASGAYASASALEMLLLGLVAGTLYAFAARALRRWLGAAVELAVIFALGGLWGSLAVALFGPDGFLHVPSADRLVAQAKGLGVALALALLAGRLLALPLRRVALLRAPAR
jgi:Amt family ammonium transporter